ncbi:type I secretion protein [Sulfitobacter sp. M57]|uniref:Hint domain-containing protein n=1 Tax=unclassified Sulfitobacter TaxID=196795 RepID=UPI0023E0C121|nr:MULTISPECIES: Hint domain-containing protein [unclassified Sulfitobacter]MDF3414694.1 type I secretion protein [Sulfitobacter sp. KE5]MDF3422175.1 type I secretion protein [Sulfitobacter sp. KE43]MDF3433240.1 type I secretion protein [Sulfitobacter sp. KE42]MDF3458880.1 type I secretion protein [Sulfitobacter sp. S74]MDF3462779.1 type I secretion protein [Sulfitobacter sp. Ks18]
MAFLYIYSPSDFINAPPAEEGAMAAGTPTFTLQLAPGATPTLVEITDNDTVFDEVDSTQSLTNAINLDGTSYAAGTTINTAYDLINTTTGHKVTSFHFGGDGYQQGAVQGIVSTVPFNEGQSYTFNTERTSHQQDNQYSDYYACFAETTLIDTPKGGIPAGQLQAGDLVKTMDRGFQPLLGVLSQRIGAVGPMAPVVFPPNVLGNSEKVVVSPQHRMLLQDFRAEMLFGEAEVLVPAIYLAEMGIGYRQIGGTIRYCHLVMAQHEIVFSNGCPSETFLSADSLHLPDTVRQEHNALFGPSDNLAREMHAARPCLRRFEAQAMFA